MDKNEKIFVVQEHNANHLHWDLRLENNGVLVSFALPKEPPVSYGIRHLAVSVDDHPLSYASFEGEIPKGNYGAGTVVLWDKGTFETVKKNESEWKIVFNGEKLVGEYTLLKFKKAGDKNWLFFKNKN